MIQQPETIEDVSEYFERNYSQSKVVAAERRGVNVLALFDHGHNGGILLPGDKRPRRLELSYRWLNRPGAELCEVMGSETTWWYYKEYDPARGLFEQFNLIG